MSEEKKFVFKRPDHAAALNEMRLSNKLCDIKIKVDGRDFPAHKVVLAAHSKYFEPMFSGDALFKESKQDVIPMEGVKADVFEAFLTYIYTGEILVTESNALDLLHVADYLSEVSLESACVEFLAREQACKLYVFAISVDHLLWKDKAKPRIFSNFEDCSRSSDYLDLAYEDLVYIFSGMHGKHEPAESQRKFLEGLVRWLLHDAEERATRTNDLLGCVDISKLELDCLRDCLDAIVADPKDEGIKRDVMSFYENLLRRQVFLAVDVTGGHFQLCNIDQIPHRGKLLAFGDGIIEVYDPIEDQWHADRDLSEGLQMGSVVGGFLSPGCDAERLFMPRD